MIPNFWIQEITRQNLSRATTIQVNPLLILALPKREFQLYMRTILIYYKNN